MKDTNKKTILVVDDTPENIDVFVGLLGKEYAVKAATNGMAALSLAASDNPPDLILLDMVMPEMDGREVLEKLKDNEKTRQIPVVIVSGNDGSDYAGDGLMERIAGYLCKPLDFNEVLKTVRRLMPQD